MKFLVFLLLINSSILLGQDNEMLNYINIYRNFHGKSSLILSEKLIKTSETQNNIIKTNDSLIHTPVNNNIISGEIITKNNKLPSSKEEKNKFIFFLKQVFNINYSEPTTEKEIINYVRLYIIFMYDQSKQHKRILLGDYNNIGFNTIIENIKINSSVKTITIQSKAYSFNNIKKFNVDFYSVIDFN